MSHWTAPMLTRGKRSLVHNYGEFKLSSKQKQVGLYHANNFNQLQL